MMVSYSWRIFVVNENAEILCIITARLWFCVKLKDLNEKYVSFCFDVRNEVYVLSHAIRIMIVQRQICIIGFNFKSHELVFSSILRYPCDKMKPVIVFYQWASYIIDKCPGKITNDRE